MWNTLCPIDYSWSFFAKFEYEIKTMTISTPTIKQPSERFVGVSFDF